MTNLLYLLTFLWLSLQIHHVLAFQIIAPGSDLPNMSYPLPYQRQFVGYYGDPNNYQRERINEGGFLTSDQEIQYEGVSPRQACPGMVGPFSDGNYYCSAREFGYCDRRSGTCFCNTGYQGIDCTGCQNTHFKIGPHCFPKKLCPNDCNGAGVCNFNNGTCSCFPNRAGESCENLLCSKHSPLCVSCTNSECLQCSPGYYLTGDINRVCSTCYDFDPRCAGCIKGVGCTSCADATLTSVRRSGYRSQDPPLPPEEVTREFSITLPFGTKSPESFAEAENYEVVSSADKPLQDRAVSCRQGDAMDASWNCTKTVVSHIVCGHYGVFTFTYPNYEIPENAGFIRMTVRRTGGGFGNATISYNIKHYSTNDSDLSATAFYTTTQQLDFNEGVIERSFLISILDDNLVEQNEVFQVILSTPEGGGSVGPQFRANVTIIDDDGGKLSPKLTRSFENTTVSVAGSSFSITINPRNGNGDLVGTGGERFFAAIENNLDSWSGGERRQSSRKTCDVLDPGTGTYTVQCDGVDEQGLYQLRTWHAFPGSLRGEYYSDAFFQNLALVRQDSTVNFTWGFGPLIPTATDYVTIRWSGAILTNQTGWYSFLVNADDQARLWIDGDLLLDHFQERQVNLQTSRSVYLQGNTLYEIVLEYREINGPAFAQLMWQPPDKSSFTVIPQSNLYTLFEIDLSPVEVTIKSGETSPYTTECVGDGLFSAKVLEPAYFSVCPRDLYGNLRNDADPTYISTQIFAANFTLENDIYHGVGATIINPVLTFNPTTSCWDGNYVPLRAGDYKLRIMYRSSPDAAAIEVSGSPFYLHVSPDQSYGPLSDVSGLPYPLYAEAGKCYNFTITMRDRYRNLRLQGGDRIQAYMFRVDYFKEFAGEDPVGFILPVGSPTVAPTFTPTMAPTTIYNNIYPLASDSGVDVVRYGIVSDLGNGNYSVRLCPVIAGTYEIQLLLGGNGVSNQPNRIMDPTMSYMSVSGMGSYQGQYIANAPYSMYVGHTVPSIITSTVKGPGLINGTVGVTSYFLLTVRDAFDNVVRSYPYKPNVTFFIDESPDAFVSVWDYKNGSYLLEYIPKKAGNNSISVFVDGYRIRYSPFIVPITDGGSSGMYTYAEGSGLREGTTGKTSYFTIFSYDLSGNRKTTNTDTYKFTIGSPENITGYLQPCPYPPELLHPVCDPLESSGGYYFGSFVPLFTGNAEIRVFLVVNSTYSMEISNSPFTALIYPSEPLAEGGDITGTLSSIEAGTTGVVNIQLRDFFGNKLNAGGMGVELAMHCVACDWGTVEPFNDTQAMKNKYNYKGFFYGYPVFYGQVLDKQDGSYQVSYLVNQTGQYVLRLSLAEAGLNATYFNDTNFGSLFNNDYEDDRYVNSLRGSPDARGTSISWTGDIGGPISSAGNRDDGSYYYRFTTRTEPNIAFNASRGIKAYLDTTGGSGWNSTHMYNMREHYWSARWIGMINPTYPELYKFKIQHDEHSAVRFWIGGKGIGMNYSDYGQLICDTTSPGSPKTVGFFNFTDTKYREIIIEFVHTIGDASLHLWWESLSTPLSIIPASAFTHWRNMSHHNVTVNPSKLCSRCSTVFGKSLTEARVAQDQSFLVYGRDSFGNLLQKGGDAPSMVAVGANGVAFRGKVIDYGNSTYRIYYYPTQAGIFRMYVTIGCCVGNLATGLPSELKQRLPLLVGGAPFILQIAPAVVNSSRSIAAGRGVVGGTVNEDLYFTIQYRDIFNNPTTVGNASYVVCSVTFVDSITGLEAVPERLSITSYKENTTIYYSFTHAGRYWMTVKLGYINHNLTIVTPQAILSSPFQVILNPEEAFTNRTVCRGLGLRQGIAREVASFEIQLYDVYGNKLIVGGDKFFIRLEGGSNFTQEQRVLNIVPQCTDTQNGRYQCHYKAYHPGPHQLRMKLLQGDQSHPGGTGLRVTYFNNVDGANVASKLQSTSILERVEQRVEVSAQNGFMLPAEALSALANIGQAVYSSSVLSLVQMGQSIRWMGYIVAPRTDTYSIHFDKVSNLNVSIFVDNRLIFDAISEVSETQAMIQYAAYEIRIEASTNVLRGEPISGRLVWSTPTVQTHPVAPFFLYADAEEFPLSPFPVVIHDNNAQ